MIYLMVITKTDFVSPISIIAQKCRINFQKKRQRTKLNNGIRCCMQSPFSTLIILETSSGVFYSHCGCFIPAGFQSLNGVHQQRGADNKTQWRSEERETGHPSLGRLFQRKLLDDLLTYYGHIFGANEPWKKKSEKKWFFFYLILFLNLVCVSAAVGASILRFGDRKNHDIFIHFYLAFYVRLRTVS